MPGVGDSCGGGKWVAGYLYHGIKYINLHLNNVIKRLFSVT